MAFSLQALYCFGDYKVWILMDFFSKIISSFFAFPILPNRSVSVDYLGARSILLNTLLSLTRKAGCFDFFFTSFRKKKEKKLIHYIPSTIKFSCLYSYRRRWLQRQFGALLQVSGSARDLWLVACAKGNNEERILHHSLRPVHAYRWEVVSQQ